MAALQETQRGSQSSPVPVWNTGVPLSWEVRVSVCEHKWTGRGSTTPRYHLWVLGFFSDLCHAHPAPHPPPEQGVFLPLPVQLLIPPRQCSDSIKSHLNSYLLELIEKREHYRQSCGPSELGTLSSAAVSGHSLRVQQVPSAEKSTRFGHSSYYRIFIKRKQLHT